MKEIKLGVGKRLLIKKHSSAKILEVDVQSYSVKNSWWGTRISFDLSPEQLIEMLKVAEEEDQN